MADAGKILPTYRGNWVSGSDYEILDWVHYMGSSYLAKKDINNSAIKPSSDSENWITWAEGYDISDILRRSMLVNDLNQNVAGVAALDSAMGSTIKAELDLKTPFTYVDTLINMSQRVMINYSGSLVNLKNDLSADTSKNYIILNSSDTSNYGYVCYYNNTTWVKGWKYQDYGLSYGEVMYENLERVLQDSFKSTYTNLSLTWHNGAYYQYTNGVVTSGDTTYNYASPINVSSGDRFIISGLCKWAANLYVITDSDGNVLTAYPNQNIKQSYTAVEFTVPINGSKLLINKAENIDTILQKLTSYNANVESGYENINWTVLGDSWTDVSTLGSGVKNYSNYVSEKLNLKLFNMGVGGSGYLAGNTNTFVERSVNIPAHTDVLTILGSFNDVYLDSYSIGNPNSTDVSTLWGAFKELLRNIYDINVGMKIGIIAPPPWASWNPHKSDLFEATGKTRAEIASEYVSALQDISKYYNLPFLDLYSSSNLRPWDTNFLSNYYLETDGVHANTEGHKFFSPSIENFIKTIIAVYD